MATEIVFVHGRSQQHKDPDDLKAEWVKDLADGLAKNVPGLPAIDAQSIRFPFYGDVLDRLTNGMSPDEAGKVIIKGEPDVDNGEPELDDDGKRFVYAVLDEMMGQFDLTAAAVEADAGQQYTEKGPLNWPWVRAIMQKLDGLPNVSAATIALATFDVYQYMNNGVIRRQIDDGVVGAITPGVETIVVAHSLGTIVAYTLLHREGAKRGWKVPLFVTVGSPLAVNAVRNLAPGMGGVGGNRTPECVGSWFNAMDPRDAVALHPLDIEHFRLNPPNPAIENKVDVDNPTSNRHGISGYLGDPVVAKRIYDAFNRA